jgi:hypothetical protein
MTNALEILAAKLEQIPNLVEDWVVDIAASHGQDLAQLNRDQLTKGFDRNGKRLRQYRSFQYAQDKYEMNSLPGFGNPDLKVTGRFHAGIRTRKAGKLIEFYGTDSKTEELEEQYTEAIIGLNEQSLISAGPIIYPDIIQKARRFFGI